MINIITVNWNCYDFLWLMIESLQRFSSIPHELIVIDNSEERIKVNEPNVHQFFMQSNIGHGEGLNEGIKKASEMFPKNPFYMFLDIDCHFLCHNWEENFVKTMTEYDVVGGKGPASKPIRPACMFVKKNIATNYDWTATKGFKGNRVTPGGLDVAIKAYHLMLRDNVKINLIDSNKDNRFGTINGEEWEIKKQPVVYHHWHGSTLDIRQEDFPDCDLKKDKDKLFQNIPWRLL